MSRGDDTGFGPCVGERAAMANALGHPAVDLRRLGRAEPTRRHRRAQRGAVPSVLVERGNMKNPADSALMKTPEGPQKYADAVVRGIAGFLGAQARQGFEPSVFDVGPLTGPQLPS
jgi:N-acetylmuramoyl-L-alanine amidase